MRIIRDRAIVEDNYTHVADSAEVPAAGDIIVSLDRYRELRGSLQQRGGKIGVQLRSDQEAKTAAEFLSEVALVAVEFPGFKDGRGYTTGRLLRERFAFQGELRAVGDVMRDQIFYMQRCGFNAFALKAGKNIEDALNAFKDFSVTYQPGADDPRPLFRRRAQS